MLLRCLLWLALILLAPVSGFADPAEQSGSHAARSVVSEDLPEDIEKQIDEQTEHLPDEVREKIREKIKEAAKGKLAEIKEAAEMSGDATGEDGKPEPEESDESEAETGEEDSKEESKQATPSGPKQDPLSEESKKLKAETELIETRLKHKIAQYKKEIEDQLLMIEKSKIDLKLEADRIAAQKAAMTRERDRLKMEGEILKLRRQLATETMQAELDKLEAEKKRIEAAITVEDVKEKLEDRVLGEERYPDQPLQDGVLTISLRRIELNGPIMDGAADYVCQRLDYFNNQSDKPIFLVIDNSPGGSAIEGMQIVQAIRESNAPVHVVVKRFAASMAAIIATLADHSYCYPDSIILHHQASTVLVGNGRLMDDQRKMFEEISHRLIGGVAEKIGLTEEEFVEQMYENRTSGDWDQFGDQAVKSGWVGNIVELVREEGVRTRPTGARPSGFRRLIFSQDRGERPAGYLERYEAPLAEEVDAQGNAFVRLPRTGPFDAWLIYNPNGYYR